MDKKILYVLLILLGAAGTCWAGCCTTNAGAVRGDKQDNAVDMVLKQLSLKTRQLKSYECQVGYRFIQPVFESQTLRKGVLYYVKYDNKTKLRINFQSLKQDDEKEQKYREEFIFDGVWLTHINYQIKQIRMHQLAEPSKPVDAFELASKNLPIVGFAKIEDLKKQFEIKLIEPKEAEQENFIHLHLKVKPDSVYKDKYVSIDFWIEKKLGLPAKIIAVNTEEDIYEIKLLKPKLNKKMAKSIFDFKVPRGFDKEVIPLKKKTK